MRRFLIILTFVQSITAAYFGLVLLPRAQEHLADVVNKSPPKIYIVSPAYGLGTRHAVDAITPEFVRGFLLAKENIQVKPITYFKKGEWTVESDDPPISVADFNLARASFLYLEAFNEHQEKNR